MSLTSLSPLQQSASTILTSLSGVMIVCVFVAVWRAQNSTPNVPPIEASPEIKEATDRALKIAAQYGSVRMTLDHLLLAILDQRSSASQALIQADVDVNVLRSRVRNGIAAGDMIVEQSFFTPDILKVLEVAARDAFNAHDDSVQLVHLLAAVLQQKKSKAAKALREGGITPELLRPVAGTAGDRHKLPE